MNKLKWINGWVDKLVSVSVLAVKISKMWNCQIIKILKFKKLKQIVIDWVGKLLSISVLTIKFKKSTNQINFKMGDSWTH